MVNMYILQPKNFLSNTTTVKVMLNISFMKIQPPFQQGCNVQLSTCALDLSDNEPGYISFLTCCQHSSQLAIIKCIDGHAHSTVRLSIESNVK